MPTSTWRASARVGTAGTARPAALLVPPSWLWLQRRLGCRLMHALDLFPPLDPTVFPSVFFNKKKPADLMDLVSAWCNGARFADLLKDTKIFEVGIRDLSCCLLCLAAVLGATAGLQPA